MKNSIMILMLLFSVTTLSAQDPVVWQDYQMKYKTQNTINVDSSLTQLQICDDVSFWLSRTNIKLISVDTCVFMCKGEYPVQVKRFCKKKQGTVRYDLVLIIFDMKFTYIHTNFTFNGNPLESKSVKKRERKQILEFLHKHILSDVNSLKAYINEIN